MQHVVLNVIPRDDLDVLAHDPGGRCLAAKPPGKGRGGDTFSPRFLFFFILKTVLNHSQENHGESEKFIFRPCVKGTQCFRNFPTFSRFQNPP
jgi:hypothetical protein